MGSEELSTKRHGEDFFESARRDTMTRIYEEDREHFLSVFSKEKVLESLDRQGVFTTTYRLIDTGTPIYVNMKINRMRDGKRLILGVSIIDSQMKEKMNFEALRKERDTFARIIALSDGSYLSLFTIDPKTNAYVEYSSSDDFDSLGAAKGGDDFFRQAIIDTDIYLYAPDRQRFKDALTKENVLHDIQLHGSFSINYHLMIKGTPRPVTLKAAMFKDGDTEKLLIGVRAWKDKDLPKE